VATVELKGGGGKGGIFQRLDQLNEFERQPVTADKLHGGSYFAAVFSGEHVAATEFVIGALFVSFGAGAFDVLVGLLIGNLLAVLSWALVCAPIAVQTRLTLYWYLRRIAGPVVMVIYNILNALLYCVLAGAMITVSASAVRIPFGIPDQTQWYPSDARFVLVTLAVGAVVVTLAILGFKALARFASVCSPWMVMMFVAGGLVTLTQLGHVGSFAGFWKVANDQIWTGPAQGQAGLGFWHVVAFAWICNLAMHLGLSDMALFRYARRASYGFYSAFGMYLGHYLSWICAGIMGAAAAKLLGKPLVGIDSGSIAHLALGTVGAVTVVIAGWTTANPTLYRAGLALQVVTPGWPRWLVTLIVGLVTTGIACFPFVFTKLLSFVGLYGLLLMPVGAIVVVEHWIFPRIGLTQYWSSRKGKLLNLPALLAWGITLGAALYCWQTGLVHLFFLAAPAWVLTATLYIVLSALSGARQALPELPEEASAGAPAPVSESPVAPPSGADQRLSFFSGGVALICLTLIGAFALCVFMSFLPADAFLYQLNFLTLVYFVSAVIWVRQREKLRVHAVAVAEKSGTLP